MCKLHSIIFLFLVDHLLCHHEDDTKALLIILKVGNVCFSLAGDCVHETVVVKLGKNCCQGLSVME